MYRSRPSAAHILALCALILPALPAMARDDAFLKAKPEDLAWWQNARFGMFVHWGPVSLKGTEIGWSRGGERRGIGGTGEIPVEEYDNLYKRFNPVGFDADEWVRIAKAAGMKYLVFTSKHHDGFCEFDSALTNYKITNSPFGRDVVKELADACHRAGLRLGFYYSPPDFHHPDFRAGSPVAYQRYLRGQLKELCSNYGKVDIIWFDGLNGTAQEWNSAELIRMIRRLQPHVLINNRAGLPADFDTPEQTIGRYQVDRPWESCITICNQWAYKPNDTMKSLKECIDTLVRCAGGDGNLLFNAGPMPTGAIEPRQVERLREMGKWLRRHGDTIYGTHGGPFRPGAWGAATSVGDRVYVHILAPDVTEVTLPPMDARIVHARLLADGEAAVEQTDDRITISVPKECLQELDTIVELRLDRPAAEANARPMRSGSLAFREPATASNVCGGSPVYGPSAALDDDPDTRWATDYGVYHAYMDLDLGAEQLIGRAYLSEACGNRVQSFELQANEGDTWRTFYAGKQIGEGLNIEFPPVRAREVRLNILEATEGPTLWEVQLLAPSGAK